MKLRSKNIKWRVQRLQDDLAESYSSLHVFVTERGIVQVRGVFPVRGEDGKILDRFQVSIELTKAYPQDLPIVRETGGRIPWIEDHHINPDGSACVMIPEERHRIWPLGAPLSRFLDGPLRNFFLGQMAQERGGPWPFGEWSHGELGLLEFLQSELGTGDIEVVLRFLLAIASSVVDSRCQCPCDSGKTIQSCCKKKLDQFRRAVSRDRAYQLFHWLYSTPTAKQLLGVSGSTQELQIWRAMRTDLRSTVAMPIQ